MSDDITQLETVIAVATEKASNAAEKLNQWVNGDETTVIEGEGGSYPSMNKAIVDLVASVENELLPKARALATLRAQLDGEKHGNFIGIPGESGFGVGVCPNLPEGFLELPGTTHRMSANYGNYQYNDGSIMCWVPKFYYKITENQFEIAPEYAFTDRAHAEESGYALHRAFIDGGQVQRGFFVDKYLCSENEGIASSLKDGLILQHTESEGSDTTPYSTLNVSNSILSALPIAKLRGEQFFPGSRFIFAALAMLSVAHGQAASNTVSCAWLDLNKTTNYPKGLNKDGQDIVDETITFSVNRTGSAVPLAKVAHNGQACGVVDLNGMTFEFTPGMVIPGDDMEITPVTESTVWVLKESVKISTLTDEWNSANGCCGNAEHVATLYDPLEVLLTGGTNFLLGNGANPVLSPDLSGDGWLSTCIGIPLAEGVSTQGTNQFGKDLLFFKPQTNALPLSGGSSVNGQNSGIWCLALHLSTASSGLRAACYLD